VTSNADHLAHVRKMTTVQCRAVFEQAARNLAIDGNTTLAREVYDAIAEIFPHCPGCEEIHGSYPTMRCFHHPNCPDRRKCAACGKDIAIGMEAEILTEEEQRLRLHYGWQVGGICGECAGVRRVPCSARPRAHGQLGSMAVRRKLSGVPR